VGALFEREPPELAGWDLSVVPTGPEVAWWCAYVSNSTDKRTHRPPPATRALPAERPPRVTTVRYTLRSFAVPGTPEPGASRGGVPPRRRCDIELSWSTDEDESRTADADPVSGERVTFHLDGEPFAVAVHRTPGSAPTWRATGRVALPNGPSGERPVTFEVAAYDMPDLLPTWTTVPVATLLRHHEVWLAPDV
jgi:hypothetical protein